MKLVITYRFALEVKIEEIFADLYDIDYLFVSVSMKYILYLIDSHYYTLL